MSTTEQETAAESAAYWERLADELESRSAYERSIGLDLSSPGSSVGDHQAATYRRTARALRLEAETGRAHCSTCMGAHSNHEHGHRG